MRLAGAVDDSEFFVEAVVAIRKMTLFMRASRSVAAHGAQAPRRSWEGL